MIVTKIVGSLFVFCFLFSPSAFAQHFKVHILQDGETLSELLHQEGYTPLYGEDRWVEKILKANHLNMEQARKLMAGRPVILPSKELLSSPDWEDKIGLTQSAPVSHGLFGNRISKHQTVEAAFEYQMIDQKTSADSVSGQEHFGFFLAYADKNKRGWNGLLWNPELDLGVIARGTNRSAKEVLSYDPSYIATAKVELRRFDSTIVFGQSLSWEAASRAHWQADELRIRRDTVAWAGGFVAQNFETAIFRAQIKLDLEKSVW